MCLKLNTFETITFNQWELSRDVTYVILAKRYARQYVISTYGLLDLIQSTFIESLH